MALVLRYCQSARGRQYGNKGTYTFESVEQAFSSRPSQLFKPFSRSSSSLPTSQYLCLMPRFESAMFERMLTRLDELYPGFDSDRQAMAGYHLKSYEVLRRDHYLWLEEHGYRLRSSGPWKDTDADWNGCANGHVQAVRSLCLSRVTLPTLSV